MSRTSLFALTASLLAGATALATGVRVDAAPLPPAAAPDGSASPIHTPNPNCPGCWPGGAYVRNLLNPTNFPNSGYNPFVPGYYVSGPTSAIGKSQAIAQQFTLPIAKTFSDIYAGLWNVSGANNNTFLSIFKDHSGLPGAPVSGCLMRQVNVANGGAVVPVNTLGAYARAKCRSNGVGGGAYWVVASAQTNTTDLWLHNVGDMATPQPFAYSNNFCSGCGTTSWVASTPSYGAESYAVP